MVQLYNQLHVLLKELDPSLRWDDGGRYGIGRQGVELWVLVLRWLRWMAVDKKQMVLKQRIINTQAWLLVACLLFVASV